MITKILAGGCSFTAGSSDINQARTSPSVWLHFLLNKTNIQIYANLAMAGSGNIATSVSIITFLQKFAYSNKDTLVIFNITELDRIDTICPHGHPDSNEYFSYGSELGFGWITEGSFTGANKPFNGKLQKNMGHSQTKILSEYAVVSLISFLKNENYNFRFMLMDHTILQQASSEFKSFLQNHQKHFINFDQYDSMYEFCKDQNKIHSDNFHPSVDGHCAISNVVLQNLSTANLVNPC